MGVGVRAEYGRLLNTGKTSTMSMVCLNRSPSAVKAPLLGLGGSAASSSAPLEFGLNSVIKVSLAKRRIIAPPWRPNPAGSSHR